MYILVIQNQILKRTIYLIKTNMSVLFKIVIIKKTFRRYFSF